MSVTEAEVRRWLEAGVIDGASAERILAYEAAANRERARRAPVSLPEVLVYLGAGVIAAGVFVLFAANWEHLGTWARLVVLAAGAVSALAAGRTLRTANRPELARGGAVAWLLAIALFAGFSAVVGNAAGWSGEQATLAAGLTAFASAIVLWAFAPTGPQVAGLAGAAFLLAVAFAALQATTDEDWAAPVFGLSLVAFGLGGLVAIDSGILVPRPLARVFAGAFLAFGGFWAGMPPGPALLEVVTFVVTAILFFESVRSRALEYAIYAVFAAFAGLVTLILRHVSDPTAAALALIAVGIVLLLAIAAISRWRPWQDRGGTGGMAGRSWRIRRGGV